MARIQLTANQQVYQRLRLVTEMAAGRESITALAHKYGISRKTAYKWFARWDAGGRDVGALTEQSRAPRVCPRRLAPATEAAIVREAQAHPDQGLVRLTRRVQRQGLTVSVYGVYRALLRAGVFQRRQRRAPRKRYRRVVQTVPGELVQGDLMQLDGGQYQVTVIDSATRYLAAVVVPNKQVATVRKALARLLTALPFPVQTLQTDHGTEFTYAFFPHVQAEHPLDAWCRQHGIRHRLIPVAYPQANGKVERVHRICRQEFYRRYRLRPGQTWTGWLPKYVDYYNQQREHGSLDWRTPAQQVQRLQQPQHDQGQTAPQTVTDV
ncbi:MAG TPA: IS481 family transposase [Armatimonadota bacterium]|jgi:transposase InsO family protein